MVREIAKSYHQILDEKIENSTVVVMLIGWLIILVGLFVPDTHAIEQAHANLLASQNDYQSTIMIDGEEYFIHITKK